MKNMLFTNLSFIDRINEKAVNPWLRKLDEGVFFKGLILLVLCLAALGFVISGLIVVLFGVFGDNNFIDTFITRDGMETSFAIGSSVGLLVGFILSLIAIWIVYSIVLKRTRQLEQENYEGLMHFLFVKSMPKLIIIFAEILAVLAFYISSIGLTATFCGAAAYGPLLEFSIGMSNALPISIPEVGGKAMFISDYQFFSEHLKVVLSTFAYSFVLLILIYVYKEIYSFLLNLFIVFMRFLPRFAIPVSMSYKNQNMAPEAEMKSKINLDDI